MHAKHCIILSVAILLPNVLINLSARFKLSSMRMASSSMVRICSRCLKSSSIVASPTCLEAATIFLVFCREDFVLSWMPFISLSIISPASSPVISLFPSRPDDVPLAPTNNSPRCIPPFSAFRSFAHVPSSSESCDNLFSYMRRCRGSATRRVSILYDFFVPCAARSFFSARSRAEALSRSESLSADWRSCRMLWTSSLRVSSQYCTSAILDCWLNMLLFQDLSKLSYCSA
mmetsp:Transcript_15229/g.36550  ORF Transcript_15229/g.36550 Transcript_15229/m.36550 type:complete len:231 (-) Transcript_15229:69-761(-)